MRPIVKKEPGESVSYLNSQNKTIVETILEHYVPYDTAKMPLLGNLGCYCSYCEGAKMPSDVAVEHIEPKGANGDETAWQNFLLCCNVCNSIKWHPVINTKEYHWPHTANTYKDFIYTAGGAVFLNEALEPAERDKAKKLFDLVKLGAYQGAEVTPTPKDYRWKKRLEIWTEAEHLRDKLDKGTADVDEIIRMAQLLGYWSVWFTVFKGYDEVRRRLISDFPGTNSSCFDEHNHYEPI